MGGTSSQEVEQAESKKATHSTTVQRRPVTTRWGIRLCGKSHVSKYRKSRLFCPGCPRFNLHERLCLPRYNLTSKALAVVASSHPLLYIYLMHHTYTALASIDTCQHIFGVLLISSVIIILGAYALRVNICLYPEDVNGLCSSITKQKSSS